MNDDSIMPYGKFKGKKLEDVPAWYLLWMNKEGKLTPELEEYVEDNYDLLEEEKFNENADR